MKRDYDDDDDDDDNDKGDEKTTTTEITTTATNVTIQMSRAIARLMNNMMT